MECVICGFFIREQKQARHLPRFLRCPNCTGYVTVEREVVVYPEAYFTEEMTDQKKSGLFSPLFDFFLWLRFRQVAYWMRSREGTILDYGCGDGRLVAYLKNKELLVEGYDPSPGAVLLAQKRGFSVFGVVPDKKYDMIMFWHSLEHTETPLKYIEEITQHLRPDGRVLIAVPNGDCLEARLALESWFCYDWPFHRVHLTPKALSTLLQKTGFRILSVSHFNLEYTVSSLAQTFLNLFLPKNALYSFVAARRSTVGMVKLYSYSVASLVILIIFSPILLLFFIVAVITKRTAAFIVVAERA